ncbi:MAG TPA: trypsin-like serine protease [Desulfobacterales bacterium]|nr:trypsin-like serine protease [Desulfobacterales bacterium]HIP39579.1 trypsin-like serine protease [Desulfocapsa sulfexigens]
MQCPSCGHKQTSHLECERCGIIFEKYQKRQERLASEKAALADKAEQQAKKGTPGILIGLCIGLVVGGGAFYYNSSSTKESPSVADKEIKLPQNGEITSSSEHKEPKKQVITPPPTFQPDENNGLEGLARQLAEDYPVNNAIEGARNATVFVKTTWGSGSGFFVSPNGVIITNRHVLEMQEKDIAELRRQADRGAKILAREEKSLRYLKSKVSKVADREMRQQLKEDIREREHQYAKYKTIHDGMLERLSEIESASPKNGVEVILIDGSTYSVDSVMLSDKYDLALITINAYDAPYIATSRTPGDQGQKVYTIGNPSGLRHTVTSGIISGYRKYKDDQRFIQTDAPINPGNSGGPLIDENGKAIGVNTMILRNTEGIGFAIPMKSVFEEFGNYIALE